MTDQNCSPTLTETQQWAIAWAARGVPVFPSSTKGKAPATRHGYYDATTDRAVIDHWIGQGYAAFSAAAGHGVAWIDADTDDAKRAEDGKAPAQWGEVSRDEIARGFHVGVHPETGAGHYAFALPDDWPEPPRTASPDPKDPQHFPYDKAHMGVSIGANLAGSTCIDWRIWGGYVKLKGPPPVDGRPLPILPDRLKRQIARAKGLSARVKKHVSAARKIRSVEDAVAHIRTTGPDGRHPALGRAVMPLVRCKLAGEVFDPTHEAVEAVVACYEALVGSERNARDEVHRDFRSAFDEVAGEFRVPGEKPRRGKLNVKEVRESLGGDTLTTRLIEAGLQIRYNERWLMAEISRKDGPWEPLSEMYEANARLLCGGLEWEDRVWRTLWLNTLLHHRVDPFLEYLNALPKWDGVPRVDGWVERCWQIGPGEANKASARWTGIHVFMGAVKRTLEPGTKLDVTPVLVGPQEIGKSWHLSSLFPDEIRGAFGDTLKLSGDRKEQLEALQGKALVEVAEMQGLTRAKLDSLKAFLTTLADFARLSYRSNPEHVPRRCVFVGTCNDDGTGVLREDTTGNRRFNILVLTGHGDHPDDVGADREQYWAEALARVRGGESPELPDEMKAARAAINDRYRMHDAFEELVSDIEGWAIVQQRDTEAYRHGVFAATLWERAGLLGHEHRDGDKVVAREGMLRTPAQVSPQEASRFAKALKARGWSKRLSPQQGGRKRAHLWVPPAATG